MVRIESVQISLYYILMKSTGFLKTLEKRNDKTTLKLNVTHSLGRHFLHQRRSRGDWLDDSAAFVEQTFGKVFGRKRSALRQGVRLLARHALDHPRHRGRPQTTRKGIQLGEYFVL